MLLGLGAFVVFKLSLILYRRRRFPEPHEDWSAVDLEDLNFPSSNSDSMSTSQPAQTSSWSQNVEFRLRKGACGRRRWLVCVFFVIATEESIDTHIQLR